MTHAADLQPSPDALADDLRRLMAERGLRSIGPRADLGPGTTGLLGLTEEDRFVTQDLAFAFLGAADHRAAAKASGLDASAFLSSAGERGEADVAAFSRALGALFDRHGVMQLDFPRGAFLGFRPTPRGMRFVVDGVGLTLRGDRKQD